jgi:Zn-dependent metalloprotease
MNKFPLRHLAAACAALLAVTAHAAPADRHPQAVTRALAHLQPMQTGAASVDAFEARDVVVDADGAEHVRFARRFQGLRVIAGDVVVHSRASGALRGLSRTVSAVPLLSTAPSLTAAQAEQVGLDTAQVATGAKVTSELVLHARGGRAALAWDLLYTGFTKAGVPTEKHVIVDAHNGRVLDMPMWSGPATACSWASCRSTPTARPTAASRCATSAAAAMPSTT